MGPRLVCHKILSVCTRGMQGDHWENSWDREFEWTMGSRMHAIMIDFGIWGRLTRPRGPFRAQGSALSRNVARLHGSQNLLQRGILYRHEKILLRQGRLQAQTQENNVGKYDGFPSISRDASVRLGSRFLWYENRVLCFSGLQRGHQENPCERD